MAGGLLWAAGHRKPGLGGALGPTPDDAKVSQDTIYQYSQRLSQQNVALEAENLELQDEKSKILGENRRLSERCSQLETENSKLNGAGRVAIHEHQMAARQAHESIQAKHGEALLLQNVSEKERKRSEALAADVTRLRGINGRIQAERSSLERTVIGLEATANCMQAEMMEQAINDTKAIEMQHHLQRHVRALTDDRQRLDEQVGIRHVIDAQLRHCREEFSSERAKSNKLQQELQSVMGEVVRARSEAAAAEKEAFDARAEAAQSRHTENIAASSYVRLQTELEVSNSACDTLRLRAKELDDILSSLRRSHTSLQSENANLRLSLNNAHAEVRRRAEASRDLVVYKKTAEQGVARSTTLRIEAERKLQDVCLRLDGVSTEMDEVKKDACAFQRQAQAAEADKSIFLGQLRGEEVVARGLRQECHAQSYQFPCEVSRDLPKTDKASVAAEGWPPGVAPARMGLSWMPAQLAPPAPLRVPLVG